MDTRIITVKGMHCNSCISLIRMELEEKGFGDKIVDIRLLEDMKGEVELENATLEDVVEVKKVINELESYQAI